MRAELVDRNPNPSLAADREANVTERINLAYRGCLSAISSEVPQFRMNVCEQIPSPF